MFSVCLTLWAQFSLCVMWDSNTTSKLIYRWREMYIIPFSCTLVHGSFLSTEVWGTVSVPLIPTGGKMDRVNVNKRKQIIPRWLTELLWLLQCKKLITNHSYYCPSSSPNFHISASLLEIRVSQYAQGWLCILHFPWFPLPTPWTGLGCLPNKLFSLCLCEAFFHSPRLSIP